MQGREATEGHGGGVKEQRTGQIGAIVYQDFEQRQEQFDATS